MPFRLPLPTFARSIGWFVGLSALHLWLGGGHVLAWFGPDCTVTDVWKGIGALAGTYYFLALAAARLQPAANAQLKRTSNP